MSDSAHVAHALIIWHERHGRHDLPWQHQPTPYRVWVSEIMLQQTQVATVIAYYARFMARFPDIHGLAAAPLDDVLHLWSGLGYYSRARNLHRCAQLVCEQHAGELPASVQLLQQLPGIGRSTAAAIVSLSAGERAAILDGNVRRVLMRYFAIESPPGQAAVERRLWQLAEHCTPKEQVAIYTQAIMDLGATICVRRRPLCGACPLHDNCRARSTGQQHAIPAPRRRPVRRTQTVVMLLAQRGDGSVLLERRPARGVWGGLWSPPQFPSIEAARLYADTHLANAAVEAQARTAMRHAFTHFDLDITPLLARCAGPAGVMEGIDMLWYNAAQPERVGLPAPVTTLIRSLS